jgi:hypothetical protein
MDTLLCNDDGDIVLGTYQPSNTLLSLSADQYTAGSATWSDQSGNGLDFTVSTNASLKGTDADGFPYMNFGGSYGYAQRLVGSTLTNIPAPTTGKYTIFCITQLRNTTSGYRTLTHGATQDNQIVIQTGTNNLGLYDGSGVGFRDSGFDVTTDMKSTRNLLVWELSTTAPIYKFQLNESGTDSVITDVIAGHTLPFASIGMWNYSHTEYWGNIYEFIVYDGVLSASERAYVAEYLTHKWDISSKLPSSFTSTHGVLTNEETLAFLYAGSGTETETTYTWDATGVTYADILVVGGGGGGGRPKKAYEPGGGGGGGEVVFRQGVPVTPGVEIKVGRGGPDTIKGGISQFTSSIQANGGGRGGGNPSGNASSNTTAQPGGPGGSGGGAPRSYPAGTSVKLSVDGMGNDGGYSTYRGGGGGGGASEAGSIAAGQAGTDGGEGYAPNVFGGWNTVYGSGGGGGARSGAGGIGGTNAGNGGNSNNSIPPEAGIAHTGSGGGGGGTGAQNLRPYGAPGGSGIVLVKPNPGALDGLGSSVYTQAVGAYALRRLFGAYTGPQIEIRRSLDDATSNVYFDKYGYPVNFDVETWLGGATGYVVTWYDQSGDSNNNQTQTDTTLQPTLVYNGNYTISFNAADYFTMSNRIALLSNFSFRFKTKPSRGIATGLSQTNSGTRGTSSANKLLFAVQSNNLGYGTNSAGAGLDIGTNGLAVVHHSNSFYNRPLVHYTTFTDMVDVMIVNSGTQPSLYIDKSFVKVGLNSTRTNIYLIPDVIGKGQYGSFEGQVSEFIIWNNVIDSNTINRLS